MLLLISDANILIDIEIGGLIAPMFSLGYEIGVPDVLFQEELDAQHGYLTGHGLAVMTLDSTAVARVAELANKHRRTSRNDLFALVLAERAECSLLSGDAALRRAAEAEGVPVHGTLWLVEEMIRQKKITFQVARGAYAQMQQQGRRLPWYSAEQRLRVIELAEPGMQ